MRAASPSGEEGFPRGELSAKRTLRERRVPSVEGTGVGIREKLLPPFVSSGKISKNLDKLITYNRRVKDTCCKI
ncbi:hypothetical protein SD81_008410 [Tolypothrix campylonemoides VB511288]|nr:hypothetical protein SD81_008410 [Tolypothrix campylonemoides VB511288]